MTSGGLNLLTAAQAERFVCSAAEEAIMQAKRFCVALSGGSSMHIFSDMLKAYPKDYFKDWHFFWADERCVPLTDSQSNYRLAKELFFDRASVKEENIHTICDGFIKTPWQAAKQYQADIEAFFATDAGDTAKFDLIILGIGEDGHTASLFPNSILLGEDKRLVAEVEGSPKPPPDRITFTPKLINNAKNILFLSAGDEKKNVIERIQTAIKPDKSLPATLIRPTGGKLAIYSR